MITSFAQGKDFFGGGNKNCERLLVTKEKKIEREKHLELCERKSEREKKCTCNIKLVSEEE